MTHRHRAWADVRLDALRGNVRVIRGRLQASTRLMAVLKADAYGVGAIPLAQELRSLGVDAFGVGDSTEAIELRQAGVAGMILVLGAIIPGEVERVIRQDISVCIHSESRIDAMASECRRQGRRARVHLKVDTGMGRLGVLPQRVLPLARKISQHQELEWEGVLTHFAGTQCAPDPENQAQWELFQEVREQIRREGMGEPLFHASASPAVFSALPADADMVRCGLALLGVAPEGAHPMAEQLQPVVSLHTQVVFLKDVRAGSSIGYRRLHRCAEPTRIATIPMGYNDGLSIRLCQGGEALVRGARARVVGAVSMDYATLDVGEIPGVEVGDRVTLVGQQERQAISLEEHASSADTIPHEVLCSIGKRVAREYLKARALTAR